MHWVELINVQNINNWLTFCWSNKWHVSIRCSFGSSTKQLALSIMTASVESYEPSSSHISFSFMNLTYITLAECVITFFLARGKGMAVWISRLATPGLLVECHILGVTHQWLSSDCCLNPTTVRQTIRFRWCHAMYVRQLSFSEEDGPKYRVVWYKPAILQYTPCDSAMAAV